MDLDDRMKLYEKFETSRYLMPTLPILARLDGRAFHSFTSKMDKPFDYNFMKLMQETTRFLVEETNALCGYTQSDEITLTWFNPDIESQVFFNGKIFKMVSILASMASVYFNSRLPLYLNTSYLKHQPLFDCRVWNVPNTQEGVSCFIWRELDATRNSLQMAGHANFSHNQLHKKNTSEINEMLFKEKGINWNDYPDDAKRGSYFQRRVELTPYSAEELERLPEKHHAKANPDLLVERSVYKRLNMPPILKVANRVDVIYNGQDPILKTEE